MFPARHWVRVLFVIAALALGQNASAQSNPTYVQFQPLAVKGVVYRPDNEERPEIGILIIHRVNNFLGHGAATELARRGFGVLTMNSRFDNNETAVIWEMIALDVKTGVEYLRKQMGVRKVVLFGHSGGGATLSFYQAVAEQGAAFCSAPTKITSCGADFPVLPRADALIVIDANLGNPIGLLRGLNPAVGQDDDPRITRPDLDPFNPANGFDAKGQTRYSNEFKQTYFEAQAARMNRLVARASGLASRLGTNSDARFPDDDVVLIARAGDGRLSSIDASLRTGLEKPRKVLKINGSTVTERVGNQQPFTPPSGASAGTFAGSRLLTIRSFLSTHAIRATNSMTGIDWCSTNNSTPCAVQKIGVPLLVTAMQGGSPLADSELVFDMAVSKDKDFVVVEGASHNFTPCTECERRKGEYTNTVRNFFDYVRRWIDSRF